MNEEDPFKPLSAKVRKEHVTVSGRITTGQKARDAEARSLTAALKRKAKLKALKGEVK